MSGRDWHLILFSVEMYVLEVFTTTRDEFVWAAVLPCAVAALVNFSPDQTSVLSDQWQGPRASDVPGTVYPNYFSYRGDLPYTACVL